MFASPFQRTPVRAKVAIVLGLVCFSLVFVSTNHAQDKGAPPWGEFLRKFGKDKLLKPPYANAEDATPKGLASKLRAREIDIPNRIKAIKYLASLDCRQFPEARDMLITAMQEDKWERVRLNAAKGLRDMLERNGCNQQPAPTDLWSQCKQKCGKAANKVRRREERAEDCHCKTCCDEDTLNALAKTAYEMDDAGCPIEPSSRVREMAVEAISVCGIPCNYRPYYATSEEPEPAPPVEPDETVDPEKTKSTPDVDSKSDEGSSEKKEPEVKGANLPPLPRFSATQPQSRTNIAASPIRQLHDVCIVSWRQLGQKVQPNSEIESVYKGRLYYFANQECKVSFDESPGVYAIAFGGCDPVHYVKTREPTVGRILSDCDGRFYLFTSYENLEEFNAHPEIYSLKTKSPRVASSQ